MTLLRWRSAYWRDGRIVNRRMAEYRKHFTPAEADSFIASNNSRIEVLSRNDNPNSSQLQGHRRPNAAGR